MNEDELRARLQAADPARHDVPAASWIDELVEATVSGTEQETAKRRNGWVLGAAAAAVVAALGVGGYAVLADDDGGGGSDEPTVMALKAPAGDSMQSCVMFSVEFLRPMQTAFDGTVTGIDGDVVTLEVNNWYKGGDAEVVEVTNFDTSMTSLDGLDFEDDQRYLVTATDGVVNICGFSAPYTDEMASAFAEAFGG